mmetsp:Transcript_48775/g.146966  ORF Transcript_48775/g.146966 Transcript_48775/m.146966 type:complete len:271 (+) Transcript_48775:484-1296(+)
MGDNGGGGFGGASQPSPGGGRQRRDYGEQTLIPLTIRMIHSAAKNAEDNMALPDGRELHQVKIIAAVRSAEDSSTKVTYQVEDGTGLLEVQKWVDDNESPAGAEFRQQSMQDHVYVRVIGQVKEYDNRKSIVAYSIRPISTGNELTYHMLEVVHSAEKYKRGQSIVSTGAAPYMSNTTSGVGFNSGPMTKPSMGGMTPAAGGGNGSSIQATVLDYIRSNGEQSEEGCSIHQVIASLTHFNEPDIRKAVGNLAAEGEIYSTINEDTYKTAQ